MYLRHLAVWVKLRICLWWMSAVDLEILLEFWYLLLWKDLASNPCVRQRRRSNHSLKILRVFMVTWVNPPVSHCSSWWIDLMKASWLYHDGFTGESSSPNGSKLPPSLLQFKYSLSAHFRCLQPSVQILDTPIPMRHEDEEHTTASVIWRSYMTLFLTCHLILTLVYYHYQSSTGN